MSKTIDAGKHVYCEKPVSDDLDNAIALAHRARAAGIKHGVLQDKLFLPGLLKLKMLRDAGFFGRILSVCGEFGYWVFEGDWQPAQRPSWNYRKADGGGIILEQRARPLQHFAELFCLADRARVLAEPEFAVSRMRQLMAVQGVAQWPRHQKRSGWLPRPAGSRDLLARQLVEAPGRRGAGNLPRSLQTMLLIMRFP